MPCWTDAEPGWGRAAQELRQLFRLARRRWWLVVLVASAVAMSAGVLWSFKKRLLESQVVIVAEEANLIASAVPRVTEQLRSHFLTVSLSNRALLRVLERHDHLADKLAIDPRLALEEMRKNTSLAVADDFRTEMGAEETRSYKIILEYRAEDPEMALKIVRELSDLIVGSAMKARESADQHALEAAISASQAGSELLRALKQSHREVVAFRQDYRNAPSDAQAAIAMRIETAQAERRAIEDRLVWISRRESELRLTSEGKAHAAGLSFRILDPGQLPPAPTLSRRQEALLLAFGAFAMLLPIIAVVVTIFDFKIWDIRSLSRLGVPAFAQIPSFDHRGEGSLNQRIKRQRRT